MSNMNLWRHVCHVALHLHRMARKRGTPISGQLGRDYLIKMENISIKNEIMCVKTEPEDLKRCTQAVFI